MRASVSLHPSLAFGVYPERNDTRPGWLERTAEGLFTPLLASGRGRYRRLSRIVARTNRHRRELAEKSDSELAQMVKPLSYRLKRGGFAEPLVGEAFALVREVADRKLGLRHFDVQLVGGWAMLNGMIAEMETGEGKTLTATLPACTAALAGIPVHIITVNDYLAKRDAELMGPVYQALGLTAETVTADMEMEARRAAYACDVTYCTNKQVAFDYLRDRVLLSQRPSRLALRLQRLYGDDATQSRLIMRGLCFGIVDEADSVLVDEAVTPLIISKRGESVHEQEVFEKALTLATEMEQGRDFTIETREGSLELTDEGRAWLKALSDPLGGLWRNALYRDDLVAQALRAVNLFLRDKHYVVDDGKVRIVDEFTGRLMADRSWERGLHQLIEVKEGCEVTGEQETVGRISYQRFFRRYMMLAGMTGTAKEVARELLSVYRLAVTKVPPSKPLRRTSGRDQLFATEQEKWAAIVMRIAALTHEGRPVLVGTRSVAASEHLSALLEARGFSHRVLNARQDTHEAEVIGEAGRRGQITVATNMAGRGTDIRLEEGVVERGGLHVIASERHEARRIDRQLFGRCGRQGDPGGFEAIISLQDELMTRYGSPLGTGAVRKVLTFSPLLGQWLGRIAFRRAQRRAESHSARMRRNMLKMDEYLSNVLAFSGRLE